MESSRFGDDFLTDARLRFRRTIGRLILGRVRFTADNLGERGDEFSRFVLPIDSDISIAAIGISAGELVPRDSPVHKSISREATKNRSPEAPVVVV